MADGVTDIFTERDGLVFQRGDQELFGVKFQHVDRPEHLAHFVHLTDCALVALALPYYLEHGHRGVMVPCPYVRKKSSGLVETGITYFVGPDVASRDLYHEKNDTLFDELGVGATAMIFHMQLAVVRASKEHSLPIDYFLTHELRRRLAVGSIVMHFAIHGPHIVVIKSPIKEADLTWGYVVRAGVSSPNGLDRATRQIVLITKDADGEPVTDRLGCAFVDGDLTLRHTGQIENGYQLAKRLLKTHHPEVSVTR